MNTSNAPPEPLTISGKRYRPIREGLASILAPYRDGPNSTESKPPKKPKNNDEGDQAVFYNPIQQFNRDLSVLAILVYGEGALITKQERFRYKAEALRRRKNKAKKRKTEVVAGSEAQAQRESEDGQTQGDSLRKRKWEDDPSQPPEVEVEEANPKRHKVDEFDADDEELEILELGGDDSAALLNVPEGVNITSETELSSGKSGSARDPAQANVSTQDPNKYPKRHGTPFTILDALSATGLRALRYAKEIPFATNIIANDLLPEAVKSIELNIDHNGVGEIVHSNVDDARAYMYSKVGNERQAPSGKYKIGRAHV